jgi:hypothetical protein
LQNENAATIIIISDDEHVKSKCDMVINLK